MAQAQCFGYVAIMITTQISLPEQVYATLQEEAARLDASVEEQMRGAVERYAEACRRANENQARWNASLERRRADAEERYEANTAFLGLKPHSGPLLSLDGLEDHDRGFVEAIEYFKGINR